MTKVVTVHFRNGSKGYYFDPKDFNIEVGQHLIVETSQGSEYVTCIEAPHDIDDQAVVQPLRPVIRIATDNDIRTAEYNRSREGEAFRLCEQRILAHELEMKLVRAECSFDGSKILFFFTADGRIDFRELVKDLASVFRSRIELRQIGVRDEAKMLGGLGICGRPFCCNLYMDDFVPVSIKMAKTQGLSLNPTKISGTCGRLMCCLNYEQSAYEDAAKHLPKADSFVLTPDGPADVVEVNLLKSCVTVLVDGQSSRSCYRSDEIVVLRNGKGSRDGIEIPREWPSRYVPKDPEEEISALVARAHFENEQVVLDALKEVPEETKGSHGRHNGHKPSHHKAKLEQSKKAAPKDVEEKSADSVKEAATHDSQKVRPSRHHARKKNPVQFQNTPTETPASETEKKPRSKKPYRHRRPNGKKNTDSKKED